MWAPHPRGRVIRRPQPDFSHRRPRIRRRAAPEEVIDTVPDSRCNYKYFGIHRTDITDHLKHTIPSHAFHPSRVEEPPLVTQGRCPRRLKEIRRPETAPASTVWFGRTCSDVSDWLRYRPPAHLGLDPDNKPLPYYPSSTSLVTDARWQTKEFPALPNILWHFWKDRPSSVPLPTNPQQVKIDTLKDALKNRIVRPRGPYTPPSSAPASLVPTPRSGAGTPHGDSTSRKMVPIPHGETPQSRAQTLRFQESGSRAQTPRLQESGNKPNPALLAEFPSRPVSAASSTLPSRPTSASNGMATNLPTSTPHGKCGSMNGFPRPPSVPRDRPLGESSGTPRPLGSCGCETPRDRPKSSCSARGVGALLRSPNGTVSPQVEAQKCACDHTSQALNRNNSLHDKWKTTSSSTTPNKPPSPPITSGKPPPSPPTSHPNPPHVPRQPASREPCKRHHATVPSGLYVQGQGQGFKDRGAKKRTSRAELARASQGFTLDDMKQISADSFATKIVWAEKCKQFGQGLPWPLEEKKAMKAMKAY